MSHDVGLLVENDIQVRTSIVGDEYFDDHVGIGKSHFTNGLGPMGSSFIWKIVSIDRSDDAMTQLHRFDTACNLHWFMRIRGEWMPCLCGAKPASARTSITKNHESGCSHFPAMPFIRTFSTATYCVEMICFQCFFYKTILLSTLNRGVKPAWFSQCRPFPYRLVFHCCHI